MSTIPSSMKALCRSRYGMPDVLEIRSLSTPTPKGDEVLVKVMATTVNRTDGGILRGMPLLIRAYSGFPQPRNAVPGTDFVGDIVAVGKSHTLFKVGDRVMGLNDNGRVMSQAEFIVTSPAISMMKIPEGIDYFTAVAGLEGGHYAYNFINKLSISPGEKVMVNGGTGAIGSAAIQFLKHYGLYVTATCRKEHIERVLDLGADRVIDYLETDFTEDKEQFDYVFDAVGKSSFGKCKRILKPKGVYISSELGAGWQNIWLAMVTPLSKGRKVIFPIPTDIPASLAFIKTLLASGSYRPLIDRRYSLNKAADAYRYMLTGQKVGSILLIPHEHE